MICVSVYRINKVFLSCFLFQALPQLISKQTIEFQGKLYQSVFRSIELFNPNTKNEHYSFELSPEEDFQIRDSSMNLIQTNCLVLSGKKPEVFTIEFKARFCRPLNGVLLLKSKNVCLNKVSILNYKLLASCETPLPRKTYHVDIPIYHLKPYFECNVELENPFAKSGHFLLTLSPTRLGQLRKKVEVNSAPTVAPVFASSVFNKHSKSSKKIARAVEYSEEKLDVNFVLI
jgi:hypothetical protein